MFSKWTLSSLLGKRSLRFRFAAFFILFLTVTLVLFSAVLFKAIENDQQNEFDAALYNYATDIARTVDVTVFGRLTIERNVILDRQKALPFQVREVYLQIIDRDGNIRARSRSLGTGKIPFFPEQLSGLSQKRHEFVTVSHEELGVKTGKSYRVIFLRADIPDTPHLILQVAVPQTLLEKQSENLLFFFLFAIPFTLFVVSIGGYLLAGRVLVPVRKMTEQAEKITASSLSERLPVSDSGDELSQLAVSFNRVLNRLQLAFEGQEQFVSDASHQLKTPLAILRGELDVLMSRERSKEEIDEFLKSASEELLYLSQMVKNLLELARLDAKQIQMEKSEFRIDEVIIEVVERLQKLAQSKGVKIRFDILSSVAQLEKPFRVKGDQELVRTMFQNLIENAIKFSKKGLPVEVQLEEHLSSIDVSVRNHGPIISEEDQARIFQRFFRAEEGIQGPKGWGLGLPLVKKIAEAHQGSVIIDSSEKTGTCFTVQIKKF